jgi:hypothetical protein
VPTGKGAPLHNCVIPNIASFNEKRNSNNIVTTKEVL